MDREGEVSAERVRSRKGALKASFRIPLHAHGPAPRRLHRRDEQRVELSAEGGTVTAIARLSGRISGGALGRVRLHLEVPQSAPPGIYRGTVSALDGEVPVSLVVPVRHALTVQPTHVVREVRREGTERTQLMLTNTGNVPIEVDHPSAVVLEPRDRSCRILRRALAITDQDRTVGPVDALIRAAAESTRADAPLAARIEGAPFTLAPGESRSATLSWRVRPPSRGVYRARLAIAGTRVRIEVHAHHGAPGAQGEP